MSLEADLVTTLAPVFSGRFFLMVAPAKTLDPYAVYQMVSRVSENMMDGATPNLDNARPQISMFARDADELILKAVDVKVAMLASPLFKSVCLNEIDTFEDPALLYGKLLDFSIWYQN